MSTDLASLTPAEFDAWCAEVDDQAAKARETGTVDPGVLRRGEDAVAETGRRRQR